MSDSNSTLHHDILVYMFDPDEGHAAEIEEAVAHIEAEKERGEIIRTCFGLSKTDEKHQDIAEADAIFYRDVWEKAKKAVAKPKAKSSFHPTPDAELESDIGLHEFLVKVNQRLPGRDELVKELIGRGWRKIN